MSKTSIPVAGFEPMTHLAGAGPKPLRIGTDERVVIFETLVYSG